MARLEGRADPELGAGNSQRNLTWPTGRLQTTPDPPPADTPACSYSPNLPNSPNLPSLPKWELPGSGLEFGMPSLFGIVQGGLDKALRRESADELMDIGFEGYALGGLSVGEPKSEMYDVVEHTAGLLPSDRPRYLMGVGTPEDLAECVARGIDMFDCVMPTRNARNGCVFTSQGKLTIKSARYSRDQAPPDPACSCFVCRRYSRSYIRHLFGVGEMLAAVLATYHNLYFYLDMMSKIRQAIKFADFGKLRSTTRPGL